MTPERPSVLTINGSPRIGGNTARVLDLLESCLDSAGVSCDRITLARAHIEPCRGCRLCFDRGETACPLKDDVLGIRDRVIAADAMVLATPVYVNDVSGTMKNFIDRLAFVCHRPAFFSTPAALIATTGGTPARHALRSLFVAQLAWGGAIVSKASFATGALTPKAEIEARYQSRLQATAEALSSACEGRLSQRPSFFSLLTFAIQQKSWESEADTNSVDYRYWQDRGWFDKKTTYFTSHQAPAVRVALARGVGRVVARFFG